MRSRRLGRTPWVCLLLAFAGLLAGCSSAHYRRSADKEVYQIIADAERRVFGVTNAPFTIETRTSQREPQALPPAEVIDDRMATNRRVLRLRQVLDLAVVNSREYQTQKEQLYLTALNLTGSRYEFTPQFFAGSQAQIAGTPDGGFESVSVGSDASMEQFFRTGGKLTVALANDLFYYYTGNREETHTTVLNVILNQPLLRGFGKYNSAVENLTQTERNVVYGIRSYHLYRQQFAVNIVSEYFRILGLKDTVRNNYTNYLRRVDTTQYNEARAVDRVQQSEVDDARSSELGARISYINSVAGYLDALDAFKLRLGLPLGDTIYLDDRDLRELERTGLMDVNIPPDEAFQLVVAGHPDVLNAIDRFEDSKRKVAIAANQLKADLNLVASARLDSDEPDDYTKFDLDKVRYTAGLRLDLPLDRLRERNTYRASLVSFQSQVRSLALTLDNSKDKILGGLRALQRERLNYVNRRAQLEVAERRVDMNLMLLQAGRRQVRDLREAQDALIQAQNFLTTTVVAYLETRLQLLLDLGVMNADLEDFWLKDLLTGVTRREPAAPVVPKGPDEKLPLPDTVLEPNP